MKKRVIIAGVIFGFILLLLLLVGKLAGNSSDSEITEVYDTATEQDREAIAEGEIATEQDSEPISEGGIATEQGSEPIPEGGIATEQDKDSIFEVHNLGNGINIGNSLDVYLKPGARERSVSEFETYWGNPPIEKAMFSLIAQKGFKSVRIPISWGDHLLDGDQIDPEWMRRVKEVVQYALDEQLYVIIDLHHELWLIPEESREPAVTERFIKIWTQIAEAFAEVDEKLIYESMNEPRLVDTKEEWTAGTSEAQGVVNRLNKVFVETIRNSGGYNRDRYLIIPAYCTSARTEALEAMDMRLFADPGVIAGVHAYYPYKFTLDEDGTSHFDQEDKKDTEDIDRMVKDLDRIFLSKGIKVVITEFGAHDKGHPEERLEWLDYYLDQVNGIDIPCFWWDNGKESRLFSRNKTEWREEAIAERLLEWK